MAQQAKKRYIVGIHRYAYRAGEPAEIIGKVMKKPKGLPERECYEIRFDDGKKDFVPLIDMKNYKIISATDKAAGRIPPITN